MEIKKVLSKAFEFKVIYWVLILLSACIAVEAFTYQQLPSFLYFFAMFVSLPLQFLFIYSIIAGRKKGIDNSEALTIFIVAFVLVNLFSNPYSPVSFFWYLFIFIDAILAPIVLIWSGIMLFKLKKSEA